MDIAIGLPTTVAQVGGPDLLAYARRAELRGFAALAALDRLSAESFEPLATLAAASAVTSRIGLLTYVLLPALRGDGRQLARQAATVQKISGGRLSLGVGLGGNPGDYELVGLSAAGRGRRLDTVLGTMRGVWAGEADEKGRTVSGRLPVGAPEILIGGHTPAAFARAARLGAGWVGGDALPEGFTASAEQVRSAWAAAGREGAPVFKFAQYFALGPDAARQAEDYLRAHYRHFPADYVDYAVSLAITDEETLRKRAADFADAGCGQLVLFPTSADPAQIDLAAEALREAGVGLR
ncbi:LLM class flavin-dependent oxidoreductase [Actinospica robiniae]|uniref:LLM class flavin-dependent oxidoreductase n=1 Tax=Actinospica robiniae TaxID=304901 RepID=UPI000414A243|nr:LLM class flavin-dependent oxidoreductase [Actinospica robiniae]